MAERLIGRGVQSSRVQKFNKIRFDAIGYSFLRPIVVFWASLKNNIKVRRASVAAALWFLATQLPLN
ncbi:MAG: hypothetical protein ACXWWP_08270 [Candidatus Binatia bacterium]